MRETTNKKIKGTKKGFYNGIQFKSQLEISCYKKLIEAGFNPLYEPHTFIIFEGLKLRKTLFYIPIKGNIKIYPRKILDITYTPDFFIEYKGYKIYFDTKGRPNETYPIKKKLFLKELEYKGIFYNEKFIFFEPHNQKQILEAIEIIKQLK